MGVWVRGQDAANFLYKLKDVQENSKSFDTNVGVVGDGTNMVLNEKRPKIRNYGG